MKITHLNLVTLFPLEEIPTITSAYLELSGTRATIHFTKTDGSSHRRGTYLSHKPTEWLMATLAVIKHLPEDTRKRLLEGRILSEQLEETMYNFLYPDFSFLPREDFPRLMIGELPQQFTVASDGKNSIPTTKSLSTLPKPQEHWANALYTHIGHIPTAKNELEITGIDNKGNILRWKENYNEEALRFTTELIDKADISEEDRLIWIDLCWRLFFPIGAGKVIPKDKDPWDVNIYYDEKIIPLELPVYLERPNSDTKVLLDSKTGTPAVNAHVTLRFADGSARSLHAGPVGANRSVQDYTVAVTTNLVANEKLLPGYRVRVVPKLFEPTCIRWRDEVYTWDKDIAKGFNVIYLEPSAEALAVLPKDAFNPITITQAIGYTLPTIKVTKSI